MNKLIIDKSKLKFRKLIYVRSQSADPSPPLGTVLGNIGVSALSFCTQFNQRTKDLAPHYVLKTSIFIYINNSFDFTVDLPSTSFILGGLKFEKSIKVFVIDRFHEKIISCVRLYQVLQLTRLQFPYWPIKKALRVVYGTIKSMNLVIIR